MRSVARMPTRRVMAARVCSGVHSEWWSTYVAASDSRSQALSMTCSMLSISVSLPVGIVGHRLTPLLAANVRLQVVYGLRPHVGQRGGNHGHRCVGPPVEL